MGKFLFAREISPEEKKKIVDVLDNGSAHIKKRVRIILLSAEERYRATEIARMLDMHPVNLRKWIHRFNLGGVKALLDAPRVGLKKKFDREFREQILDIVKYPPRARGVFQPHWTLKNLKDYVESKKITLAVSQETIRRILQEAGLNVKDLRSTGG